jgi:hypothetical protein
VPYYRGDYYRGDYYRGDLKSFFKKAVGTVTGAVKGFITGGPVGAITGAVSSLTAKPAPTSIAVQQQGIVGTAVKVIPGLLAGKEAFDVAKGFGLFGGGENGRKRRTMNHLNPRALARSTRRIEGFIKKARKIASPLGYTLQRRGSARCAPKRKCR